LGAKTAENLCLGFGCWGKRNFAKVSSGVKPFLRDSCTLEQTRQTKQKTRSIAAGLIPI